MTGKKVGAVYLKNLGPNHPLSERIKKIRAGLESIHSGDKGAGFNASMARYLSGKLMEKLFVGKVCNKADILELLKTGRLEFELGEIAGSKLFESRGIQDIIEVCRAGVTALSAQTEEDGREIKLEDLKASSDELEVEEFVRISSEAKEICSALVKQITEDYSKNIPLLEAEVARLERKMIQESTQALEPAWFSHSESTHAELAAKVEDIKPDVTFAEKAKLELAVKSLVGLKILEEFLPFCVEYSVFSKLISEKFHWYKAPSNGLDIAEHLYGEGVALNQLLAHPDLNINLDFITTPPANNGQCVWLSQGVNSAVSMFKKSEEPEDVDLSIATFVKSRPVLRANNNPVAVAASRRRVAAAARPAVASDSAPAAARDVAATARRPAVAANPDFGKEDRTGSETPPVDAVSSTL